jgi:omega-6 fatty acid desaturase (delta-12 desaturase)
MHLKTGPSFSAPLQHGPLLQLAVRVHRHAFFHNISTDHVTHHLFSRIPHYYSREATNTIVLLLDLLYKRGDFGWNELKLAFAKCQWVEGDERKDSAYFGREKSVSVRKRLGAKKPHALWYRSRRSPASEYRMRKEPEEVVKHKRPQ